MIPKREDLIAKYYVRWQDVAWLLRKLYALGASKDWVRISEIDLHPSKLAFLLYYLWDKGIVTFRAATRARTAKITNFIQLPPGYDACSEVKFLPGYREKIGELHLLG